MPYQQLVQELNHLIKKTGLKQSDRNFSIQQNRNNIFAL